jgi:hypothetical protein
MAATANGCTFMTGMQDKRDPNAPEAVIWDFSRGNGIEGLDEYALQDMKRRNSEVMSYDDPIHLTLRLPDNRVFDENLQKLFCKRNDRNSARVESVTAKFPFMTIKEVEHTGNRLLDYWEFDHKSFNKWCQFRYGVIPEDDERLSFSHRFYSYLNLEKPPSFSLEIIHTNDIKKPWQIIWEVSWVSLDAK